MNTSNFYIRFALYIQQNVSSPMNMSTTFRCKSAIHWDSFEYLRRDLKLFAGI